jgi:four helix bundle protein
MRDFTRLAIWQRSRALAAELVALNMRRTSHRAPGLLSQIRRAAMSIPANIAEGCGHDSPQEFVRFLSIAVGSATELESHLLLARETGLIARPRVDALLAETIAIRRMTDRLRSLVRN